MFKDAKQHCNHLTVALHEDPSTERKHKLKPVQTVEERKEILLAIQSNLKEKVILTDTGSAKKEVNKIISNLNLKNVNWIASHPIAGTEYSGPEAGFASLFKDRWCIISAEEKVPKDKIKVLENFWTKLGSKTKLMNFDDHDYVLSLTSHLPHVVAYSIVKTVINNKDKFKDDVIEYSAGGLRDFTRIAASDPTMWRDILLLNKNSIFTAWKAGEETNFLAKRIKMLNDEENVVISIPLSPYRCPPGPYERASLIASYIKQKKLNS